MNSTTRSRSPVAGRKPRSSVVTRSSGPVARSKGRRASSAARRRASVSRVSGSRRRDRRRRLDLERRRDHLGAAPSRRTKAVRSTSCRRTISLTAKAKAARRIADDPQRGRYVVGGVPGLQLIEKPQSLLREGERQAARSARPIGSPATPPRRRVARRSARRGRRSSAWRTGCGAALAARTHAKCENDLHGQQRVPAELEEIIVDADALEPEDLGEDAAQRLFRGVPRRDIAGRDLRSRSGAGSARGRFCRWASAAARRARRKPRDHLIRQLARQRPAQLRDLQSGSFGGDHIGDETLVAGPSSRAMTTASRSCGRRASAASISPSSMRKPRIFTRWSMRPRNSMFPSADSGRGRRCDRARSPAGRRDRERSARR